MTQPAYIREDILVTIARKEKLPRCNLSNLDLSGADMSGSSFERGILSGANLADCNPEEITFLGCDITRADLLKCHPEISLPSRTATYQTSFFRRTIR